MIRQIARDGPKLIWWTWFKPFDFDEYIVASKRNAWTAFAAWLTLILILGIGIGINHYIVFHRILAALKVAKAVAIATTIATVGVVAFVVMSITSGVIGNYIVGKFAGILTLKRAVVVAVVAASIIAVMGTVGNKVIQNIESSTYLFRLIESSDRLLRTLGVEVSVTKAEKALEGTDLRIIDNSIIAWDLGFAITLHLSFVNWFKENKNRPKALERFSRGVLGLGFISGVIGLTGLIVEQWVDYPLGWRTSAGWVVLAFLIFGLPLYLLEVPLFLYQLRRARRFQPSAGQSFTDACWRKCVLFADQVILFPLPKLGEFLLLVARHDGIERAAEEINYVYERTFQHNAAIQAFHSLASDPELAFEYLYRLRKESKWELLETYASESEIAKAYVILGVREMVFQRLSGQLTKAVEGGKEEQPAPEDVLSHLAKILPQRPRLGWFSPFKKQTVSQVEKDFLVQAQSMSEAERIKKALEIFEAHATYRYATEVIQLYRLFGTLLRLNRLSDIPSILEILEGIKRQDKTTLLHADYAPALDSLKAALQRLNSVEMLERFESKREYLLTARDQLWQVTFIDKSIPSWLKPEGEIMAEIAKHLVTLVDGEITGLQARAILNVALVNPQIPYGEGETVTELIFSNSGQSVARDIRLSLSLPADNSYICLDGNAHSLATIEPGIDRQAAFRIQPQRPGSTRFTGRIVYSDAEREGKEYSFGFPLEITAVKREQFLSIQNPYISGNPVASSEMFFGRQDVLDYLRKNAMSTSQKNTLVLYGQRRTGKTSILLKAQRDGLGDDRLIPVFLDAQGVTSDIHLFSRIAEAICTQLRRKGMEVQPPVKDSRNGEEFRTTPYETFDDFCRQLSAAIGERRVLLMIDEFEEIESRVKDGDMKKAIFGYLRNLMQFYEPIVFVFCGGHRLEEMTYDYWNIFFNTALYHRISFLNPEDAGRLITKPTTGDLEYDPLAVEQILKLTHAHAYFTQLFCYELVNYLNDRKERNYATRNDVDAVAGKLVREGNPQFTLSWEEISPDEHTLLSALAEGIDATGRSSLDLTTIETRLRNAGVSIPRSELQGHIESLAQREVLGLTEAFHAHYQLELFRFWVARKHPLRQVREEIR